LPRIAETCSDRRHRRSRGAQCRRRFRHDGGGRRGGLRLAWLLASRSHCAKRRSPSGLRGWIGGRVAPGQETSAQRGRSAGMKFGPLLRRYWQETLLAAMVALPWLSLLAFGLLWLWQSGYVAIWALASAVIGLATWPWARYLRHRAREDAR